MKLLFTDKRHTFDYSKGLWLPGVPGPSNGIGEVVGEGGGVETCKFKFETVFFLSQL